MCGSADEIHHRSVAMEIRFLVLISLFGDVISSKDNLLWRCIRIFKNDI